MRNIWKSYWAFTNIIYKAIMLILIPIVLILGCILSVNEMAGNSLYFIFALFVLDTESDFFFMNGAYQKGYGFSELMMSSSKYIRCLKQVTAVDIVRRLFVFQIPFVIEFLFAIGDEGRMIWCRQNAFWPWLAALMAQSVVLIARHFFEWIKIHFCMTMGAIFMMLLFVIVNELSLESVALNGVLMVAFGVISLVTIWYTQKRGKEMYYD